MLPTKTTPSDDHQHPGDLLERVLVVAEGLADRRGGQPEEDEDQRERGDEQQARDQHAAPVGVVELGRLEAGHRREVAGHEGQHARGEERDEAGREGGEDADAAGIGVHRERSSASVKRRGEPAAVLARELTVGAELGEDRDHHLADQVATLWVVLGRKRVLEQFQGALVVPSSQAAKASARLAPGPLAVSVSRGEVRPRRETVDHEVARESGRTAPRVVLRLIALEQEPPELRGRLGVSRVELERRAQRLLVALFGEPVGLRGDELDSATPRSRAGGIAPVNSGDDLAVLERLDGGDAADVEARGDRRVGVDVELGELDLAVALLDLGLERRAELATGAAPLGPEVDDDGQLARALDDVVHEGRFGNVLDHCGRG